MENRVIITVLSENTSGVEGLTAEYGLSLWIEADGLSILFDTGMAGAFEPNADKLGVDLSRTVHLVLSHGHFDHTGGIPLALRHAPGALIHLHPDAALPKFLGDGAGKTVAIGMPGPSLKAVRDGTSRCLFLTGVTRLTEHVFLTGPIPRKTSFEKVVEPFALDEGGHVPDPLEDDQALWIETDAGLIIVLGCAHSGVVNTVEFIREKSGRREIRAVIGGMHLTSSGPEAIEKTAEAIASWSPGLLAPNHCTGDAACALFRERFPDICAPAPAGTVFTFA
jgi:7,8-dihydropterin-6-yl-methyl-4-(beta-D-ribofuranosyl)aminobenzene 5'-phosphate synthase